MCETRRNLVILVLAKDAEMKFLAAISSMAWVRAGPPFPPAPVSYQLPVYRMGVSGKMSGGIPADQTT